ncbi:hypothetical protein VE03_06068 [Pseudogymnoascus sp. 23342-1-I1]|nr:hypothetical protein VE03_06068 [Pseudogymnoascus sp. 23342-1-I1]
MAPSLFTYNITRPYPFRWFTPLVVISSILALLLFTTLNLVTAGYVLSTESSQNPNATIAANGLWFRAWPSYFSSKMQPSCEPVTLPVGSRFFTNHTGLTYTLVSVTDPSTGAVGGAMSPSLSYLNQPLENCEVSLVQIEVSSADRTAWQFATTQWGAASRIYITCGIFGPNGFTSLNLTVEYDLLPTSMAGFRQGTFKFLKSDQQNGAALWWGESLLSIYWNEVSYTMQRIRDEDSNNGDDILRKGSIALSPSTTQRDITQPEFFDLNYRFIKDNNYDIVYRQGGDQNMKDWIANKEYPNIWLPADNLGKSLFSVTLSDLGQKTSSILTDTAVLQKYTEEFPNLISLPGMNAETGPAKASYENLKNSTGPLETSPAIISAKYLCQVPRRRAMGALIMALILANLVLLRASWALLTFFTSFYVTKFDPAGK